MESLSESVQAHDKYQFEVKFAYPLDRARKSTEYHVETCLFVPGSLGVNASNYSREEFFDDTQKYIRFKTPVILLRSLNQDVDSPLAKLAATMKCLAETRNPAAAADFEERLKMFCSVFKSSVRDEVAFLECSGNEPNFDELASNFLRTARETLLAFRALKILVQAPTVETRLLNFFELADEFLSITACKHLSCFGVFLQNHGHDALLASVVETVDAEIAHRAACHMPSVPRIDSDNEELLYREGVLKKLMASILFLRTTTSREGKLLEQLLFGLAAGLAMAFATFVAFYSRTVVAIQDFSLSFFLILVGAYMFKDRIKEMSRNYFSEKLRERLYDRRTDIFNALDKKVGVCKESFSFVPPAKLPPGIERLRGKDGFKGVGEEILLCRKSVRLYAKGCERIFSDFNVDGVIDIMRFNIRRFLEKMDNPAKEILTSDGERIVSVKGKRVYRIDLVIRYGMDGHEDAYCHFRLVLARNGIKRIEPVQ